MNCARCGNVLIGTAWTCLVHGDQRDVGNREPALESIRDRRQARGHELDDDPGSARRGVEG